MPRKAAAERRVDLVEAAIRVIARDGIHSATVRAIVAEAEVPLATFHYVFESREQMLGEAYASGLSLLTADPLERLPADATLTDAVSGLMHAWFGSFIDRPEVELAMIELMSYVRRTSGLRHLHEEVQQRYQDGIVELLALVESHFGIESATPPRELATLAIQLADGLQYSWLRTEDTEAALRMIERVAVPALVDAIERRR